jgi:hypothetical protein
MTKALRRHGEAILSVAANGESDEAIQLPPWIASLGSP